MRWHGRSESIVTDRLRSYGAELKVLSRGDDCEVGRWADNRAENSYLPFRRPGRAMLLFRRMRSLQLVAAIHASICNPFNQERTRSCRQTYKAARAAALVEWRGHFAA